MVFTNLPPTEKSAFFSLLDEYFQSRPEIFQHEEQQGESSAAAAPPPQHAASVSQMAKSFGSNASSAAAGMKKFASAMPASSSTHKSNSSIDNLQSSKKFGHIDTGSKSSALLTTFRGNKEKTPHMHVPPAFSAPKSTFAPPPPRAAAAAAVPPPEPEPEEPVGQWAEALYDYVSDEPGDLQIRENQRILVVEQTSADWWTGEVNGKRGLFPATYAKLL